MTLSVADELQKLATLRDAGVLTDSEFESQKSKLLGMTPAERPTEAGNRGREAALADQKPDMVDNSPHTSTPRSE